VLATPGEPPVPVAARPARATDTTGAGDAFCGAFLSRWLTSTPAPPSAGAPAPPSAGAPAPPGAPDSAGSPTAALVAAAEFAVQVAATVVTRFGARPV